MTSKDRLGPCIETKPDETFERFEFLDDTESEGEPELRLSFISRWTSYRDFINSSGEPPRALKDSRRERKGSGVVY
jgi:hypothetical protein